MVERGGVDMSQLTVKQKDFINNAYHRFNIKVGAT